MTSVETHPLQHTGASRARRPGPFTGLAAHLSRRLPAAPVEMVLNRTLAGPLGDGRLDFLTGRVLALEAPDIGLRWPLGVGYGRLLLLAAGVPADAVIRADVAVFAALACRRMDPDAAFFQRRLVVEGDTELALAAKNVLDAIDADSLPRLARRLLRV